MTDAAVPHADAPRPHRSTSPPPLRLIALLIGGNVLAIGMIVALAALSLVSSREVFRERALVASDNLARSLAQAVAGQLQSIDRTLRTLSADLVDAQAEQPLRDATVNRILAASHVMAPEIDALAWSAPRGRALRHPATQTSSPVGIGEAAEQAWGPLTPDVLHLSEPFQQPGTNRWMLALSRRVDDTNAAPGVVRAEVDLSRFRALFSTVEVGRRGAITLRSASLRLLTRFTGTTDAPVPVGSAQVSAELSAMVRHQPEAGNYVAHTAIDDIERANAYHRVPGTGMLVLVGLETTDYLAPWRTQVRQVAALSGLLALTLVAASLAVYIGWRRVATSRADAQADARWHRALLRTAGDGLHVLDRAGRVVELSEAFSRSLGYRREEMLGMSVFSWDDGITQARLDALFQSPAFTLKLQHRHRDGHTIDVELTGTVVEIEGSKWLFCASRDVTERNQTARELQVHRDHLERLVAQRTAELQAGETRFRTFMDATPATTWIKDGDGRLLYANAAWEQAFSMAPGQWAGRTAHDLLPEPMARALQDNDDAVLRTGGPVKSIESTRGPDGRDRHWQTVKFALAGPEGDPQVGGVAIDITAQVEAEAERAAALVREQALRDAAERQADRLREAIRERDEFVRVMAHEVRQPLNNASAALESAAGELAPGLRVAPEQAMQRVHRAQGVIRQIVGALDNTLAATALLTSGIEHITGHDADVDVLIDLSLADLPAATRERVRVERISPTRTASMDSGLMRLALRNVMINALAYSPPGSAVVLRVTDSDEPLALVFEVLDAGPGVRDDLLPRLFERGVRGHHDLPGHGIGLYVVKRVMELHGGSVDLRPNQPTGTVFRLSLPQDR